ncbi:MAG: DUF72 domain-containing protein [Candidatus Bathyarchaeota archaeon]|nr:MAG: DUF72 domain-containing protein [Candidatus Bathyarchaeota archaeon]
MTRYLIGAGGWAYFQVPGERSLAAYSKAFNFVEVNSTFYEISSLRLVKSWRSSVPQNFEFAVRCNKALTHQHKFQATSEAYETLRHMIIICKNLKANILHLQTPSTFRATKANADLMRNFLSSTDLKGVRIALEMRGAKQPLNSTLIRTMQDLSMIHCVDLSKDEEPAYESDIMYSRLFGRGSHNIYQPTDEDLVRIDRRASKGDHKTVAVSFHFVRMYKDAARYKTYRQTGKFPMITESTGQRSLIEVLQEDAEFPSSRKELILHQGWKLIDLTEDKRVHASYLLQKLPERTYRSINEIAQSLNFTKTARNL